MKEKKYYYCEVCGNVVDKLHDSGNELMCCMRTMKELVPGETDGKTEFHIPVCTLNNNNLEVRVGKENHPMESYHYIQWIEVITTKGEMRKYFEPGQAPVAHFHLCDGESVCAVFAYCNVHKLWKAEGKCGK